MPNKKRRQRESLYGNDGQDSRKENSRNQNNIDNLCWFSSRQGNTTGHPNSRGSNNAWFGGQESRQTSRANGTSNVWGRNNEEEDWGDDPSLNIASGKEDLQMPPKENFWQKRKEFYQSVAPKDETDEEKMLQAAIELSRLESEKHSLRVKLEEEEDRILIEEEKLKTAAQFSDPYTEEYPRNFPSISKDQMDYKHDVGFSYAQATRGEPAPDIKLNKKEKYQDVSQDVKRETSQPLLFSQANGTVDEDLSSYIIPGEDEFGENKHTQNMPLYQPQNEYNQDECDFTESNDEEEEEEEEEEGDFWGYIPGEDEFGENVNKSKKVTKAKTSAKVENGFSNTTFSKEISRNRILGEENLHEMERRAIVPPEGEFENSSLEFGSAGDIPHSVYSSFQNATIQDSIVGEPDLISKLESQHNNNDEVNYTEDKTLSRIYGPRKHLHKKLPNSDISSENPEMSLGHFIGDTPVTSNDSLKQTPKSDLFDTRNSLAFQHYFPPTPVTPAEEEKANSDNGYGEAHKNPLTVASSNAFHPSEETKSFYSTSYMDQSLQYQSTHNYRPTEGNEIKASDLKSKRSFVSVNSDSHHNNVLDLNFGHISSEDVNQRYKHSKPLDRYGLQNEEAFIKYDPSPYPNEKSENRSFSNFPSIHASDHSQPFEPAGKDLSKLIGNTGDTKVYTTQPQNFDYSTGHNIEPSNFSESTKQTLPKELDNDKLDYNQNTKKEEKASAEVDNFHNKSINDPLKNKNTITQNLGAYLGYSHPYMAQPIPVMTGLQSYPYGAYGHMNYMASGTAPDGNLDPSRQGAGIQGNMFPFCPMMPYGMIPPSTGMVPLQSMQGLPNVTSNPPGYGNNVAGSSSSSSRNSSPLDFQDQFKSHSQPSYRNHMDESLMEKTSIPNHYAPTAKQNIQPQNAYFYGVPMMPQGLPYMGMPFMPTSDNMHQMVNQEQSMPYSMSDMQRNTNR